MKYAIAFVAGILWLAIAALAVLLAVPVALAMIAADKLKGEK